MAHIAKNLQEKCFAEDLELMNGWWLLAGAPSHKLLRAEKVFSGIGKTPQAVPLPPLLSSSSIIDTYVWTIMSQD